MEKAKSGENGLCPGERLEPEAPRDLSDRIGPALWFTEHGSPRPIGMVLVRQLTGRFRGYVGNSLGVDEQQDRLHIARRGARLPAKVLPALFSINPELAE